MLNCFRSWLLKIDRQSRERIEGIKEDERVQATAELEQWKQEKAEEEATRVRHTASGVRGSSWKKVGLKVLACDREELAAMQMEIASGCEEWN